MKKLFVLLMMCLISLSFASFSAFADVTHDNLDSSIKITATVDGKIIPENGNVPMLSSIDFLITANSDLDMGHEYAYPNGNLFECGATNLYDPNRSNNTIAEMNLIMREGGAANIDGVETPISYGPRVLHVTTKDGKYNDFVWNVVEMDITKRYIPDGFKIVRIETAEKELSQDINNPTSLYAQDGGIAYYANMPLLKEVSLPEYLTKRCYQVDSTWHYENTALFFDTDGSGSLGWGYGDEWDYAGKVTGFKLIFLDYDNTIISESPTYYVKWELRSAQQYGGLVKKISLTTNTLNIEPKDNYWMRSDDNDDIILIDKTTGASQGYTLELYNFDETAQCYKNARVTDLQLNPEHVYEVTIEEHRISTLFDPTQVNIYTYNAVWVSELIVEGSRQFADVNQNDWFYDYIKEAIGKNIIEGYEDGSFRPQGQVTRSEFAKIMLKYLQIPLKQSNTQTFADVAPGNWAFDYVESVKSYLAGYSDNGSQHFRGTVAALREDMAVAMVKAMGLENENADENELSSIFSDWQDIAPNLHKYVLIAYKNHLIDGYPDGRFGPQQTITRAEATAMLAKAYQSDAMEKVVWGSEKPDVEKR